MLRLLATTALLAVAAVGQYVDYTPYVNVFMGTENGGNRFPGVARPYGMVKLGPDCYTGVDAYSGYQPSGVITGYSMMHESGTGGAPKYGVVSQMPVVGNVTNPLANLSVTRSAPDQGTVGYYQSSLSSGVQVELAASEHAGIYQYTFPKSGNASANVVIDVSHVLPSFRGQGLGQNYTNGSIHVYSDGHYTGHGNYDGGWNRSPDWTIYFCGRFSRSASSVKVFSGDNTTLTKYGGHGTATGPHRLGAVYSFPPGTKVASRVGLSWISTAKACDYLDRELPTSQTFSQAVSDTKSAWNSQVLSKITTPDADKANLQLLYSSLYGMHLLPSNRTGENPKWTSAEPYFDDFFTLWDLHRCSTALWQVLQPTVYEAEIRTLIDVWRHEGYMPDARSSNFNGRTQGGSNADNVLADAYVKGVRGGVNWADGYAAMLKDAEVTPPNNFDPQAPDSSTKEGRGALPDWLQYNYITPNFSRSVSRAVEYSVNDFALYQVAKGLGKTADATKYLKRSQNWRNHWNPKATSLGFSGFVVPRAANRSFLAQDPLSCGDCYWGLDSYYYEGLPWEYSMGATHDVATLVAFSGGPKRFVQRLETFFVPGLNPANSTGSPAFGYTIFNPSNEPSFTTPYLYHFAGRPDLSVKRSRYIGRTYYNASSIGLPGNSDAGAMETWILWNMLGLYPMTSMTTFLIHSPWFNATIDLGAGKTLRVTAVGGNVDTAPYVQSLCVNGKDWHQNWLTWDDVFAKGGTMDFVLGPKPSTWFDKGPLPPSPGSVNASGYGQQEHKPLLL